MYNDENEVNASWSSLVVCSTTKAFAVFYVTRILFGILYVAIFILSVSGNLLVVYTVLSNKSMQTVTNIFITNLAISDLLVNFTSLWLTPMYLYIGHWIWGGWLCYGLPLFQGTSIFISSLTLMAIAVDRYIVIVHRSNRCAHVTEHRSISVCLGVIVVMWTVSLLLVMPYAVHMSMIYVPEPCDFWLCAESWTMEDFKSIYGIIVMSLQFLVPFVIIGISYSQIWNFLSARKCLIYRRGIEAENARKKRLLRMLITMVVLFGSCWFPFNLLNILRDLHFDGWFEQYFHHLFLAAHVISMSATCLNPIVYAWMNETFRAKFIAVIPCLRRTYQLGSRRDSNRQENFTFESSRLIAGTNMAILKSSLTNGNSDQSIAV